MQPREDAYVRAEREQEARSRAAAEMAAMLGVGEEAEGEKPSSEPNAQRAASIDAGARSKPMRQRRTAAQAMHLAIFGHDHDDVPPGVDEPPAA